MSSPAVSSPTAWRRPAAFAAPQSAEMFLRHSSALPKLQGVTAASRLEVRPTPEMISSGVVEIDALTGGLPRGCLTEICGTASSGRTSVLVAALAAATRHEEACALVDITDAFDPRSAAGVQFERLLWVRCGEQAGHAERGAKRSARAAEASPSMPEIGTSCSARNDNYRKLGQALRVTDLLLQSGGFGLVAIDLSDLPLQIARRVPLASWFRFQRAVENTPTVLLIVTPAPCAQSCAALLVRLRSVEIKSDISSQFPENREFPPHSRLFEGMHIESELLRSRLQRKPAASVRAAFTAKTAWAG